MKSFWLTVRSVYRDVKAKFLGLLTDDASIAARLLPMLQSQRWHQR